jgi:hypothetical protein
LLGADDDDDDSYSSISSNMRVWRHSSAWHSSGIAYLHPLAHAGSHPELQDVRNTNKQTKHIPQIRMWKSHPRADTGGLFHSHLHAGWREALSGLVHVVTGDRATRPSRTGRYCSRRNIGAVEKYLRPCVRRMYLPTQSSHAWKLMYLPTQSSHAWKLKQ